MSREIKFRVWNKNSGEMTDDLDIRDFGQGQLLEAVNRGNVEIMQYTGFKDKNGVEIYEGDILRLYFDVDQTDDWLWLTLTDQEKKNGHLDKSVKIPEIYQEAVPDEIEVIGNIYENPELLEIDDE